MTCQASLSRNGFSRQAYWSILANTGCHSFWSTIISCCPSLHLSWVPGAAKTPETQAVAPPPHLALTGANPGSPRQPQEQTPVDDPHAEVAIKPQLKPRGSVAKEEDPNFPTSCAIFRLNPHDQLGSLCVCGIYRRPLRAPTHKRKCNSSDSCGRWRQEHIGVGSD